MVHLLVLSNFIFIKSGKDIVNEMFIIFLSRIYCFIHSIYCSGFNDKIDGKYEAKLKGPFLRIVGKYKINGNILILPIQGAGDSNISISMFYPQFI